MRVRQFALMGAFLLEAISGVTLAGQNLHAVSGASEPLYPYQYYLHDINIQHAWSLTTGSPDIVVAIVDEGLGPHVEIPIARFVDGYDFWDDDNDARPFGNGSHGIASAGIIAAAHNGVGIAGIAPQVRIMPIRLFERSELRGSTTSARMNSVASAIDFAWQNGADIIYNGWGLTEHGGDEGHTQYQPIAAAVQRARDFGRNGLGSVVVAASGNHGHTLGHFLPYPASDSGVLSVSAVNRGNELWYYSVIDGSIDVVAQTGDLSLGPDLIIGGCRTEDTDYFSIELRGDVWTTEIDALSEDWEVGWNPGTAGICERGYFEYRWSMDGRAEPVPGSGFTAHFGGTSAAAPQAAGIAALILSINDQLTEEQVRDIIRTTSTDIGPPGCDDNFGCGLLNAGNAVQYTLDNFGNTGVTPDRNLTSLTVFPVPARDELRLEGLTAPESSISVIDLMGRTVMTTRVTGESAHLNTSSLPSGTYFYRVSAARGPVESGSFVIVR